MLIGWRKGYLFAYTIPAKIAQQFYKEDAAIINKELLCSVCWGALFFVIGFWLVRKKVV